jgi:predicted RNA polymerase sigma factor
VTTVAGVEGPHNVQVSPDGASVWTVSGHDGYAAMLSAESLDLHGVVPTGCEAARPEDTDWPQILALYDHLHALAPGPMESLSRIVALAQVHGPVQAEAELEAFADDPALGGQYRVDAVRGHLKELAGDRVAARTYYLHAARHSLSVPEQRHLLGRADRLN